MIKNASSPEELKLAFHRLNGCVLAAGIATVAVALLSRNLYDATQVSIGVGISVLNMLFYSWLGWLLFVKKNIAWIGAVIVIKYLFLALGIYLVWTYGEVVFVLLGLFSEIVLTALFYLLLKLLLARKAIGNGSL